MRFGRLVCAIIGSMLIGLPAAAQQQPSSVPPPPPETQTAPTPPPFAPMPKREPRHRFVDMGSQHSSHAHHKATSGHHKATSHKSHKKQRAKNQAKKDLRWCKSLSHRELAHNKKCGKILAHHSEAHYFDVTKARTDLTSALQARRVLSRLRERHFQNWRTEDNAQEMRQMDELALTRYTRRDNGTTNGAAS